MNGFDLVIHNGTLVDPQRERITVGNIGVRSGVIAAITREEIHGNQEIDAGLKVVCPGFVDIHAHVDGSLYAGQCMMRQGVTTTVGGNCGLGPVNLSAFFDTLESQGFPVNQAMLIGHSFTLREAVGISSPYAEASREQIDKMVELTREAFEAGAIGLSFGLEYAPGTSFEEILALSKLAAKYDRLVAVHLRTDGWNGLGALQEALRINQLTGAAVQISHLAYQVGMGMMTDALGMIEDAVDEGWDITADSGLYHGFATFINSAVFDEGCVEKWRCSYNDLIAATGKYAGERLTRTRYQELRALNQPDVVVALVGQEAEVYEALLSRYVMVSSDGAVGTVGPGVGHPQDVGTFPRFFQKMVRETAMLTLVEAVKKCTLLPAQRLKLPSKGRLAVGADADLVILDLDRIADHADYPGLGKPDAPPEGILKVIVQGTLVVDTGKVLDDVRPGRVLKATHSWWNWI